MNFVYFLLYLQFCVCVKAEPKREYTLILLCISGSSRYFLFHYHSFLNVEFDLIHSWVHLLDIVIDVKKKLIQKKKSVFVRFLSLERQNILTDGQKLLEDVSVSLCVSIFISLLLTCDDFDILQEISEVKKKYTRVFVRFSLTISLIAFNTANNSKINDHVYRKSWLT